MDFLHHSPFSSIFYTTLSLKCLFIDFLYLCIIPKTLSFSLSLSLDRLHNSLPLQLFDLGLIIILRQAVPPVLQGLSDHGGDVGVVVLGPAPVTLHDQVVLPPPRGAGTTEPPTHLSLVISWPTTSVESGQKERKLMLMIWSNLKYLNWFDQNILWIKYTDRNFRCMSFISNY